MLTDQEKQGHFLALYLPLQKRLERFVLVNCRDDEEARDTIGETILAAYEGIERLSDPKAFLSFLFTIATRIRNHRKHRGAKFEGIDEHHIENLLDESASPEVRTDISALNDAINMLPVREREDLILFEILGFSMNEIVEMHGGSIVALKVRLMRSRKKLRNKLNERPSPKSLQVHKKIESATKFEFVRSEQV